MDKALEELAQALAGVTRRAATLRACAVDPDDLAGLARALAPAALDIGEHTVALLAAVAARSGEDEAPEDEGLGWLGEAEGPRDRSRGPGGEVADLCFLGRAELGGRIRRLQAAQAVESALGAADQAMALLGALQRTAAGVVRALSARLGCTWDLPEELAGALAVRRAYAEFRRALAPGVPGLNAAGLSLTRLASGDLSRELRISDRVSLARLRRRLALWQAGRDPAIGAQLASELMAFGELLGQISQRAELVEHDRVAVAQVRAALVVGGLGADELAALGRLYGCDPELDAAIAAGSPGLLAPPLERLHHALSGGAEDRA